MAIRFKNPANEDPFGFKKFHPKFQAETVDASFDAAGSAFETKQKALQEKIKESNLEDQTKEPLSEMLKKNPEMTDKLLENFADIQNSLNGIEELKKDAPEDYKRILEKFYKFLKEDKGALSQTHKRQIIDEKHDARCEAISKKTNKKIIEEFAHVFLKQEDKRVTEFTSTPGTYKVDFGGYATTAYYQISLDEMFPKGTTDVKSLTIIHQGKEIKGYRAEDGVFYQLGQKGNKTKIRLLISHNDQIVIGQSDLASIEVQGDVPFPVDHRPKHTLAFSDASEHTNGVLPLGEHHSPSEHHSPEPPAAPAATPARDMKAEAEARLANAQAAEAEYEKALLAQALDPDTGLDRNVVIDLNTNLSEWFTSADQQEDTDSGPYLGTPIERFTQKLPELDYGPEVLSALTELLAFSKENNGYATAQSEIHLLSDLLKQDGTISYKRLTWSLLRKRPKQISKNAAQYEDFLIAAQKLLGNLAKIKEQADENMDPAAMERMQMETERRTVQRLESEHSRGVKRTFPKETSPEIQEALTELGLDLNASPSVTHESIATTLGIKLKQTINSAERGHKQSIETLIQIQNLMDALEEAERENVEAFLDSAFDLNASTPIVKPRFWDSVLKNERAQELNMQWFEGKNSNDIDTMNNSMSEQTAWLFLQDAALQFAPETGQEVVADLEQFKVYIISLIEKGRNKYEGKEFKNATTPQLSGKLEDITELISNNDALKEFLRIGVALEIAGEYMHEREEEAEYRERHKIGGAEQQKQILEQFDELGEFLTNEQLSEIAKGMHEYDLAMGSILLKAIGEGEFDFSGWGIDFNIPIPILDDPMTNLYVGFVNGVLQKEIEVKGPNGLLRKRIPIAPHAGPWKDAAHAPYVEGGVGFVNGLPGLEIATGKTTQLDRYGEYNLATEFGAGITLGAYAFFANLGLEREFEGAIKRRTDNLYQKRKEKLKSTEEDYLGQARAAATALAETGMIDPNDIENYVQDAKRAANEFTIKELGDQAYEGFNTIQFKGIGISYVPIKVAGQDWIKVPVVYIKGGVAGKTFRVFRKPQMPVNMSMVSEKRFEDAIQRQIDRDNDGRDPHGENVETHTYFFEGGTPILNTETGKQSITEPKEDEYHEVSGDPSDKSLLDKMNEELMPSGVYLEKIENPGESPKYRLHVEGVEGRVSQYVDPASKIETYIGDDGYTYINVEDGDTLSIRRAREYNSYQEFGSVRPEMILISDNIHTPNEAIIASSDAYITYSRGEDGATKARIVKIRDAANETLTTKKKKRRLARKADSDSAPSLSTTIEGRSSGNIYESEEAFKDAAAANPNDSIGTDGIEERDNPRRIALQDAYDELGLVDEVEYVPAQLQMTADEKVAIDAAAKIFMEERANNDQYEKFSTLGYHELTRMNYTDQIKLAKTILNANGIEPNNKKISYTIQKLFEESFTIINEKDPTQVNAIMDWNYQSLLKVLTARQVPSAQATRIVNALIGTKDNPGSLRREALEAAKDPRSTSYSTIREGAIVQIQAGGRNGIEGHRETNWNDTEGRIKLSHELTVKEVENMGVSEEDAEMFVDIMLNRADELNASVPYKLFTSQLGQKILQAAPYYFPLNMTEDLLPILKAAKNNPEGDWASIIETAEQLDLYNQFTEILRTLRKTGTYSGAYKGEEFQVSIDQNKTFGFYEDCFNFTTELYETDPAIQRKEEISVNAASAAIHTVDALESGAARNVTNVGLGVGIDKDVPEDETYTSEKQDGGRIFGEQPLDPESRSNPLENAADIGSGGTPTGSTE